MTEATQSAGAPEMRARVFGKWILAGEHSVLRGCPALVFPVFSKSLEIRYFAGDRPLSAEFSGEHGRELQLLFWGVIERSMERLGRSRDQLSGRIELESEIPIGAGLGASAALCVAVTRWLYSRGWVGELHLYEFSRQLENLFHGESSGVDIAVALSGKGLYFERSGTRIEVESAWNPRWYLSYSGKRGVTSECVSRVKALWERDAAVAQAIDSDMRRAVQMASRALAASTEEDGFAPLAEAIGLARSCFDRWGLAGGETASHLKFLEESGAAAAKPTGSGDGGYALSLWRTPPPSILSGLLIPIGRS